MRSRLTATNVLGVNEKKGGRLANDINMRRSAETPGTQHKNERKLVNHMKSLESNIMLNGKFLYSTVYIHWYCRSALHFTPFLFQSNGQHSTN